MPISGPTSYVPTTQAFLDHWTAVNGALPPAQPLLLPTAGLPVGAVSTRAQFLAARQALLGQRDAMEELDLNLSFARATLDLKRTQLHAWMNLFNDKVRGGLTGTAYERSLADVPGVDAGLEAFTKPMKRTLALWVKINNDAPPGFPTPMELQDGTLWDDFEVGITALASAFDGVTTAETMSRVGIEKRNDLQVTLYEAMKAYRLGVPGRFMPENALVESLPALSPESGRTPEPVSLAGAWDATEGKARLTATASADADLQEYEVRYCVGPDYEQDQEHVAGTIAPGAGPLVLLTTKGVAAPGAVGSYRVYVILNSGHEAGSNTVAVTRPG